MKKQTENQRSWPQQEAISPPQGRRFAGFSLFFREGRRIVRAGPFGTFGLTKVQDNKVTSDLFRGDEWLSVHFSQIGFHQNESSISLRFDFNQRISEIQMPLILFFSANTMRTWSASVWWYWGDLALWSAPNYLNLY